MELKNIAQREISTAIFICLLECLQWLGIKTCFFRCCQWGREIWGSREIAAVAGGRVEWLCFLFFRSDDIVRATRNGFDNIRTNISKWSIISLSFISAVIVVVFGRLRPSSAFAMLFHVVFFFLFFTFLFRCRISSSSLAGTEIANAEVEVWKVSNEAKLLEPFKI